MVFILYIIKYNAEKYLRRGKYFPYLESQYFPERNIMSGNPSISSMNIEFEEFLFASVGEQKNGMPVSTFSALARLDIDPWREAKRLSDLPKDRAIQALRGSIDRLADLQWTKIDAGGIAANLVRLLPNHGSEAKRPAADDGVIRPGRAPQPSLSAGLLHKASSLPMSVWLAIGAAVIVVLYVAWPGDSPSQGQGRTFAPSSYDAPVREQPRR
jgi:hypothetical protein